MARVFKLKELHIRWTGIIILAFFFSIDVDPGESELWHVRFLHSFFTSSVFWNGCVLIFFFYRKTFPRISQTPRKLLYTILTIVVFLTVVDPLMDAIVNYKHFVSNFSLDDLVEGFGFNLLISAFLGMIYESVFFYDQWKKSIQLAEALKTQQIRTQIEVLQNQMSPHFLFNSLNTLSTLIMENQKAAVDFTDHLSEVYRYILQNREKEVVRVKDELEFVKSYVHLLKMRYPENLEVVFDVDNQYLGQSIAPLTLQMLVENAIKHNVISSQMPLKIDLYVNREGNIVVSNNLQRKKVIEKSTKTGLANIKKRYSFFNRKLINISENGKHFSVEIPLLNVVKNEELSLD